MYLNSLLGIMIPFLGTIAGASFVFFMRKELKSGLHILLNGFAAGVMTAASIWSLIIPALSMTSELGSLSIVPAVLGIVSGFAVLIFMEHTGNQLVEKSSLLQFSINLHNLPEGMAVGLVYAAYLSGAEGVNYASALSVSLGIAAQNLPEGAIISLPMHSRGISRSKAFLSGIISGLIEVAGAIVTIMFYSVISLGLPFLLSFAAGAMLYVVVSELLPAIKIESRHYSGLMSFVLGFCLMMAMDVLFS